jgi:2'-5' RNA ligase superfamily
VSTPELGSLQRFRTLKRLHNHWGRPPVPRAYCWFLTFEECPGLQSLARDCQEQIAFPYYDPVAMRDLHLTLGRVAFEDRLASGQLDDLLDAARRACLQVAPLTFTVGALGGTAGAVGFSAYPREPIVSLRNTLREATLATCPDAPGMWPETQPHLSIAYANADVPATAAIAAVARLHARSTEVTVRAAALVLLERREHAYTWQSVDRVPLTGCRGQ